MCKPHLPSWRLSKVRCLHCAGKVLYRPLDLDAKHLARRFGDRSRLNYLGLSCGFLGAPHDVLDHLRPGCLRDGGHPIFQGLKSGGQLRTRLSCRLARSVEGRHQRFDPIEQPGDIADRLGNQRLARGAWRLHAFALDADFAFASADPVSPKAVKHASSSGSTPLAKRLVASFCASASLSSVLRAFAMSAL